MTYLVSVYDVALAYGGPEEGDWWYQTGSLIRTVKVFRSENRALAYCRQLNARLQSRVFGPNVGRYPVSSVLSDGECEAQVHEGVAPPRYPDRKPRYE